MRRPDMFDALIFVFLLACSSAYAVHLSSSEAFQPGLNSTGRIETRLDDTDVFPSEAPTTVRHEGKLTKRWQRSETRVHLQNWLCMEQLPNGAVRVDMLCCEWRSDPANRGRFVLVQRESFDNLSPSRRAAVNQECRVRNGARPSPTP